MTTDKFQTVIQVTQYLPNLYEKRCFGNREVAQLEI